MTRSYYSMIDYKEANLEEHKEHKENIFKKKEQINPSFVFYMFVVIDLF
jgi:hypothetical protein